MRCVTLNTGTEFHSLDHIAPLASLLRIPLITAERRNFSLAKTFYPDVECIHMPDLEFQLSSLAAQYDALIECKYWPPHLKSLFRDLHNKEMQLIFCPHGQSDKGFQTPLLAPYVQQDAVLIYGELMIQMLKDLSIWPSISKYAIIGNYRLQYYLKHLPFYNGLTASKFNLNKNKTLLYAPTWRDADSATSFYEYGAKVIRDLPSDWNLLLKPHPLLEERDPAYYYSIVALAEKRPNIFLIEDFPLVYPLLSLADIYLGDASSVGYDFLYFQKPLFFFPTNSSARLHTCGRILDPTQNIYMQLDTSNPFKEKQKDLYHYAFGLEQSEESLRSHITAATCSWLRL